MGKIHNVCVFSSSDRVRRRKILDDLSAWTIQLGMTRRHSHSLFGRKVKVEKIIRHEMYNNGPIQHDHDIALFKVSNECSYVTRAEIVSITGYGHWTVSVCYFLIKIYARICLFFS